MPNCINSAIREAIAQKASDIHVIEGQSVRLVVRKQVNELAVVPSEDDIRDFLESFKVNREGFSFDFGFTVDSHRIRANYYCTQPGLALAMRLLPDHIPTYDELNLPNEIRQLSDINTGLVLVTGAVGSGKSSTIAAILNDINCNRSWHVVTAEDPIEYVYESKKSFFSQREVLTHTASFADAARDAMRENPDAILIGETRDPTTAKQIISLAETNHVVFTTLHSDSAVESVTRLCDMFEDRERSQIRNQIVSVLSAIVHQSLVKTSDGKVVVVAEVVIATNGIKANLLKGTTANTARGLIASSRDKGCIDKVRAAIEVCKRFPVSEESIKAILTPEEFPLFKRGME